MTGLSVFDIALVAGVLLTAGFAIVAGLMLTPAGRPIARDIAGSVMSFALTVVALFAAFLGGAWTLAPFLLMLAARSGYEVGEVRIGQGQGLLVAVISAGVAAFAMSSVYGAMILMGLWLILFGRLLGLPWSEGNRLKPMVEIAVFPILPLGLLAHGALDAELRPLMLVTYILIETFDSYALVIGKAFGRRKAFPVLSPRKTVEGLAGGAVFLILTAGGVALLVGLPVMMACLVAALVGILGLAGDLGASRLKRLGGVKDFPVVLRHQGGAFDIFDSWIAAGGGLVAFALIMGLL